MDTTTKNRRIAILCAAENHRYCIESVNPNCECGCHFEVTFGDADLFNLAYELWKISNVFEGFAREHKILEIIRSTMDLIDSNGLTSKEILEKLEPTLARDYWSRRETAADFGIAGY